MKRNNMRNRAFTLVEIMIVVLIIGILMAIAVPNFVKARESSRKNSCIANLKQIDSAKEQWAMDNKKDAGASVAMTDLVGATLYLKANPSCPSGGTYTVDNIGTNPSCSVSGHALP
ncbi:MAG: prepilin-type N-terminal cleavage/methylation domain-containing protein [Armatimonadetes bacterium]|nr:prepilin-type N-terminal cleavage/methylation domain-containing protein [Armatimonadota bacterium]MBS1725498.1 prepilin-type N-terminal cleavage/methylation domain-containing protein [Armatimonadota bacterium]